MKCPKCSFTSFDYLEACRKCGTDLRDVRSMLQIIAVSPENRALLGGGGLGPRSSEEPSPAAFDPVVDDPAADLGSDLGADLGDEPAPAAAEEEALLADLNFDESFAGLVDEPAPPPKGAPAAHAAAPEEDDGLLELDFGDAFGEADKP